MAANKKNPVKESPEDYARNHQGDLRSKVKAEDVTEVKDYERAEIDASGSKDPESEMIPAQAVVVPVSKPSGDPVQVLTLHIDSGGYENLDEIRTIGRLEKLSQSTNRAHPFAPANPAAIDLDTGLQCLRMMVHHGVLADDERERLVNRVNVLLRAHPPIQLSLQVGK